MIWWSTVQDARLESAHLIVTYVLQSDAPLRCPHMGEAAHIGKKIEVTKADAATRLLSKQNLVQQLASQNLPL